MPFGDSERARKFVAANYFLRARINGETKAVVRVADVCKDMNPRPSYNTTVAQALKTSSFHEEQHVKLIDGHDSYARLVFKIMDLDSVPTSDQTTEPERQPQLVELFETGQDVSEALLECLLELSPSEFQELAREYLKAKGFDDAEMEITIRMKM